MTTRLDLGRILFLVLFGLLSCMAVMAGNLKGNITDKATREPLTGATVQVVGTALGAVADIDGNYQLDLKPGTYTLQVSYVGYKTEVVEGLTVGQADQVLNFELDADTEVLGEVTVTARKNLEGERALQMERQKATLAIENMGAKEMTLKGISNVQEGVKQITGISIADAGQLIVRGLGDRYSTTTLNGLPIASPNPDNKLIPLDLFPSSTVQNITVSKVYDAAVFADYSGAHIDISTKENTVDNFFNVSFNVGGRFNTLGQDFYQMDRGTLFKNPSMDQSIYDMSLSDFEDYVTRHDIFHTTFEVEKKTALPEFGGNIGFGRNIGIGDQTLSLLASLSASNGTQIMKDAFYKTLEATGNIQNDFGYDEYTSSLKLAGLASASMTLRRDDRISYTFFYARNAEDSYQRREGVDAEGHPLIGSNDITHIYTLQNHQLNGLHHFGRQWELTWGGSYGKTGSEEPDRRQVMFEKEDDGTDRQGDGGNYLRDSFDFLLKRRFLGLDVLRQRCDLAEFRLHSRGDDDTPGRTGRDAGSGKDEVLGSDKRVRLFLERFMRLPGGCRFAVQGRLRTCQIVTHQDSGIGGYPVAFGKDHDVPRHQIAGGNAGLFSVSDDASILRKHLCQGICHLSRLELLHERKDAVDDVDQPNGDSKIEHLGILEGPEALSSFADKRRDERKDAGNPKKQRHRRNEVLDEYFPKRCLLFLGDFILPVFLRPFLDFGIGKPLGSRP